MGGNDEKTMGFLAVLALAVCVVTTSQLNAQSGSVYIKVLSNRARHLSGGDALVEIGLPPGATASGLKVAIAHAGGAQDVSSAFALRSNGKIQGLVTGLPNGSSELVASVNGKTVRLAVTNLPSEDRFSRDHRCNRGSA